MNHLFVTYEIAKLLKEKGFDEPCIAHYVIEDSDFRMSSKKIVVLRNLVNSTGILTGIKPSSIECNVCAPFYQQAVDFILSKGVYVGVSDFPIYNDKYGYRYGRGTASGYTPNFDGTTRYEALEKAILEALTLIKK